ncbi:MAG TPA: hypothetical protein VF624_04020, partial [Tepidisphaeraceae bacterium]
IERTDDVLRDDGAIDMRANGTGWVTEYNSGRRLSDYLLYTSSAFLTGWEWPRDASNKSSDDQFVDVRTLKLHKWGTVALICGLAAGVVPWRKIFATRRSRRRMRRLDRPLSTAFAARRLWWVAAWALVPAGVLYTQSFTQLATPADGLARLVLESPPDVRWPRLPTLPKVDDEDLAPGAAPAVRPTYFDSAIWTPFRAAQHAAWNTWAAAFTRENLAVTRCALLAALAVMVATAVAWRWRTMAGPTLRCAIVVIAFAAIFTLLAWVPRRATGSTWMPRYVAVVLPALLVAAAALVARLPGWPTRAAFVALFAVVNFWQFASRALAVSEIPIDRIARDVVDAQPREVVPTQPPVVTRRTYVQLPGIASGGPPGRGTLGDIRGAYYLWLYANLPATPREILYNYHDRFRVWPVSSATVIERDLMRSRQIDSIVVWTGTGPGKVDQTDPIADRLAGRFRRTGDEVIPVYDHWTWMHLFTLRRRAYVKLPGADMAATRPATTLPTQPRAR